MKHRGSKLYLADSSEAQSKSHLSRWLAVELEEIPSACFNTHRGEKHHVDVAIRFRVSLATCETVLTAPSSMVTGNGGSGTDPVGM